MKRSPKEQKPRRGNVKASKLCRPKKRPPPNNLIWYRPSTCVDSSCESLASAGHPHPTEGRNPMFIQFAGALSCAQNSKRREKMRHAPNDYLGTGGPL